LDDKELKEAILSVKAGDKSAYESIVNRHQQSLFIYCYHLLMQQEEAEDAVQDVFVKAYEKIHSYTYGQSFTAWLYKIAYHQCVNLLRKRKRSRLMQLFLMSNYKGSSVESGYERVEWKPFSLELTHALRRLSPPERALIVLRVVQEKSYEEISLVLNSSPTNLRKKLERVKIKLRNLCTRMEAEEYGTERSNRPAAKSAISRK
jgi:RNA polymerase sigma-70 factor (ECF subfamily)